MSYKTILVHAGPDQALEQRVRAAAGVGARFGSTLIGAGAVAWDPYIDPALGYVDGETIQILRNEVDAAIKEAETRFRAATTGYIHPTIWRAAVDYPDKVMASLACAADLIVACRTPKDVDQQHFASPASLIMETGLPVLLLAPGCEAVQPRTVMIGWKNTRESRRAVADALPFLKAAERVVLVAVSEKEETPAEQVALADAAGRLERHGVNVECESFPLLDETVAENLLDLAEARKAELLVLGAYGHSRLREWAFGGVTADLLDLADRSILFSR